MPSVANSLRKQLRDAGLTARAIDAVWPEWWSADAEASISATNELRYTVARRLGLAPRSLFEGPPRFVWKDDARFKNLGTTTEHEAAVLGSFAVAVGRCAIAATPAPERSIRLPSAMELRLSILASSTYVGLTELLATAWGLGFPTIYLKIFPLRQKHMHAVATRLDDRYALLIGRESTYAAQVAYFLAHELGHIAQGHIDHASALLDVDDPLQAASRDEEEQTADEFALELLTGSPDPDVDASVSRFTATQLASAALETAPQARVDPGVLVLCLAHRTKKWPEAFGALKILTQGGVDVASRLNEIAATQFDWASLSLDNQAFLRTVMGNDDDAP